MQERLAAIVAGFEKQPPDPNYFRMLSGDLTEEGLPDLGTVEGQAELDAQIGDAEIIFADNISTLVRSGKENEAEGWTLVQEWGLRHRRCGRSIIFVHHANKNGMQRGTSKREDVLDTVIVLKRPADYTPEHGARFEVHFEKSRGFLEKPPSRSRRGMRFATMQRFGRVPQSRTKKSPACSRLWRTAYPFGRQRKNLACDKSKVERIKKRATTLGMSND